MRKEEGQGLGFGQHRVVGGDWGCQISDLGQVTSTL